MKNKSKKTNSKKIKFYTSVEFNSVGSNLSTSMAGRCTSTTSTCATCVVPK